jgi:hypothetical protein
VVRILDDDLGRLLVSAMMDLSRINRHIGAGFLGEKLARVRHSLAAALDRREDQSNRYVRRSSIVSHLSRTSLALGDPVDCVPARGV